MTETETTRPMSSYRFIERILRVIAVLGIACLVIGLLLFVVGRTYSDSTTAMVGAYILLIGVALTGMRIFYWIVEEMVGRGLESMAKQNTFRMFVLDEFMTLLRLLRLRPA